MDRTVIAAMIARRLGDAEIAEQWSRPRSGTPTRYAIVDDLLPTDLAEKVASAFPADDAHFRVRDSFRERKRTSTAYDDLPPILREATFAFQLPEVSRLIAHEVGMGAIDGDATLYAGGLSMMRTGDFLNPHIDNSHDANRIRYRRINLLYYATPNWQAENGGNLELWDERVSRPVTLPSLFNRLIIMETNRGSWHSVSPVIADRARNCVSNYYFSPSSPSGDNYFHITAFSARPEQKVRRVVARLDAIARSLAGEIGLGRGKRQAYNPTSQRASAP